MPTWKKYAKADDAILKSLLTEQGDIIYASGVGTPAALAHGTSTQYLKSGGDAANPSWDTPAGGGLTYTELFPAVRAISTANVWTDWNLTGVVPAGTKYIEVVCWNISSNQQIGLRVNGSALERKLMMTIDLVQVTMTCALDANLICEVFATNVNNFFRGQLIGYWK